MFGNGAVFPFQPSPTLSRTHQPAFCEARQAAIFCALSFDSKSRHVFSEGLRWPARFATASRWGCVQVWTSGAERPPAAKVEAMADALRSRASVSDLERITVHFV